MKLTIAVIAAAVFVRWTTPGPGSWSLLTWGDNPNQLTVEACGHEPVACHVTVKLPKDPAHRFYRVEFDPDKAP